jgi:HTH-type transcriptional regulator/antitoxin HigA
MAPADLAPLIGGRNRVSEILNRKRRLTVTMMRRLHRELGIPAEALLQ